eukprot:8591052-Pyramimonas_sp.AAC.1
MTATCAPPPLSDCAAAQLHHRVTAPLSDSATVCDCAAVRLRHCVRLRYCVRLCLPRRARRPPPS